MNRIVRMVLGVDPAPLNLVAARPRAARHGRLPGVIHRYGIRAPGLLVGDRPKPPTPTGNPLDQAPFGAPVPPPRDLPPPRLFRLIDPAAGRRVRRSHD